MNPIKNAGWITAPAEFGEVCPVFKKAFVIGKPVSRATLHITALGVYEAVLGGQRVGDFIMAPGWTSYKKRLQYQSYDITSLLTDHNELDVTVGPGWCVGRLVWKDSRHFWSDTRALLAALEIRYADGDAECMLTDESWQTAPGPVLMSEIYDGETYDARVTPSSWREALPYEWPMDALIPQQGEMVREIETLKPAAMLTTPKGERVVDFGQNLTGYVHFRVRGQAGDTAELSHAEILDHEGNFYTENLRSARQKITYICGGGEERYKPHLCFQGFRYIRLDRWPGEPEMDDFEAVVVHSDLQRTGFFECSDEKVNQLFRNIIWGQRGNFLDVPTDCPQRDERLGWTGDAQVFARAASYNFNVDRFFTKWLRDLAADQFEDGGVPHVIPNVLGDGGNSAAWGDAAVIIPWQMYLTYGDRGLLDTQFDSMKKWVEYVRAQGDSEYLWNTGQHFGDWLGLDAPSGSYKGSTDEHLIATAFYAHSVALFVKAGRVLGQDMSEYETLHQGIVKAFQETYMTDGRLQCNTQTTHVLALHFNLAPDKKAVARSLAELIHGNGDKLTTGFVGTPYLLHALSANGYGDLAYTLLLQQEYPSWLYSVNMGATTIWEHWDGVRPDGSMWSKDMNSFNHYAYGAVADWMYGVMAGIGIDEDAPAFRRIRFSPLTDPRLSWVQASIETGLGTVLSRWERKQGQTVYTFEVPQGATATAVINGKTHSLAPGRHTLTE